METNVQSEGTARLAVMGEGETEVQVSSTTPPTFGELLDAVGITDRGGSLYLDGQPVGRDAEVRPGSVLQVLRPVYGG